VRWRRWTTRSAALALYRDRIIPHTALEPAARSGSGGQPAGQPAGQCLLHAGGKIAFYFGILHKLQLNDDEVATIMGHEAAHALREHARERMGKTAPRASAPGWCPACRPGGLGDAALSMGGQLLTLQFSRSDETEADLVGMDLAPAPATTRPPRHAVAEDDGASKGAPRRSCPPIRRGYAHRDIQDKLPKVLPLHAQAPSRSGALRRRLRPRRLAWQRHDVAPWWQLFRRCVAAS